jgi:hypothetical protein
MPAVSKSSSQKKITASKKKPVSKKDDPRIKYSDKSAGQEPLVPIFEEITKLLSPYNKGTMKLFGGTDGKVMLISKKPVEILGKKREELWFASALVQKGYVGFYYMPVHSDNAIKKMISPELLKCLKGKACFHIKKFDKEIFSQIKEALKIGYDTWRSRGWI